MSPSQPTSPSQVPHQARSRLAVGALAGIGASVLLFALSPSSASSRPISFSPSAAAARPAPQAAVVRVPAAAQRPATIAAPAFTGAAPQALPAGKPGHGARSSSCKGASAATGAFMAHLNAAHLEASPSQQVADASDVDQYAVTHTVLVEHMVKPLVAGATASRNAFLRHLYAAHLEASPSQQVADATDVDQYTETHTVMAQHMVAPVIGSC